MTKRIFQFIKKLHISIREYPLAFVASLLFCGFSLVHVWFDDNNNTSLFVNDFSFAGMWSFGFVILASILGVVIRKNELASKKSLLVFESTIGFNIKKLIENSKALASLIFIFCIAGLIFIVRIIFGGNHYVDWAYAGLMIALFCVLLYVAITDENSEVLLLQLVTAFLIAFFIAFVFFLGISVCFWAVDSLIVSFKRTSEVYFSLFLFSFCILGINVFLANFKLSISQIKIPAIIKNVMLYILLPLYALLMCVLYVYFIKILLNWKLPNGRLNGFVLLASLVFVFFRFTLSSYHTRQVDFFYAHGHWFLVVPVCFQIIAVSVRVSIYGLTTPRFAGILSIILFICYLILIIVKHGKYEKCIMLVAAFLCIISTFTPLHIEDFPARNQAKRLTHYLQEAEYFDAEGVFSKLSKIDAENLSFELRKSIGSSYLQVYETRFLPSYLVIDDELDTLAFDDLIEHIFGFEYIDDWRRAADEEKREHYSFSSDSKKFSVLGYSYCVPFTHSFYDENDKTSESEMFFIEELGKSINLSSVLLSHKAEGTPYLINNSMAIILFEYDYSWLKKENRFSYYHVNGYILEK